MKYCRIEDDVFYQSVMTNTNTKTNTKTQEVPRIVLVNSHLHHLQWGPRSSENPLWNPQQALRQAQPNQPNPSCLPEDTLQAHAISNCPLSFQWRKDLQMFLEKHQLEELKDLFQREGATLNDVLSMEDDDIKDIGIEMLSLRRSLKRAIRAATTTSTWRLQVQEPWMKHRNHWITITIMVDRPCPAMAAGIPREGEKVSWYLDLEENWKRWKCFDQKEASHDRHGQRTCSSKNGCITQWLRGEGRGGNWGLDFTCDLHGRLFHPLWAVQRETGEESWRSSEIQFRCPWNHNMSKTDQERNGDILSGKWTCKGIVAGISDHGHPDHEVWTRYIWATYRGWEHPGKMI